MEAAAPTVFMVWLRANFYGLALISMALLLFLWPCSYFYDLALISMALLLFLWPCSYFCGLALIFHRVVYNSAVLLSAHCSVHK